MYINRVVLQKCRRRGLRLKIQSARARGVDTRQHVSLVRPKNTISIALHQTETTKCTDQPFFFAKLSPVRTSNLVQHKPKAIYHILSQFTARSLPPRAHPSYPLSTRATVHTRFLSRTTESRARLISVRAGTLFFGCGQHRFFAGTCEVLGEISVARGSDFVAAHHAYDACHVPT